MCPAVDRSAGFSGGAPWVAVPRPSYVDDALRVHRSSAFASRGSCGLCDRGIFIRYDCESYTDWVHADCFELERPIQTIGGTWAHIHCLPTEEGYGDGVPVYDSFQPWEPDPCRPNTEEAPMVCLTCFQLLKRHKPLSGSTDLNVNCCVCSENTRKEYAPRLELRKQ